MKNYLIAALLLSTPVLADEWSTGDTQRQLVYTGLIAIDLLQTNYIHDHPERFCELNPILGKHPSRQSIAQFMVASAVLNAGVSYLLPAEYRKSWQLISIGYEGGIVVRNAYLGIGVSTPWN